MSIGFLPEVYKGFMVVSLRPASMAPKTAIEYSGIFGKTKAIVSLGCRFRERLKKCAKDLLLRRVSANV